jgi:hypothetical protein
MLKLSFLFLYFYSFSLAAQSKGLERINFLPDTDAYAKIGYRYTLVHIETPKNTTMTKEVQNISNLLQGEYAHRFGRKYFAGLKFFYEEASENAVAYGVPFPRRFTSHGKKESPPSGLIDLFLAFSPKGGKREIDRDNSNRLNARNIFKLALSHGLLEEDWEFKTEIGLNYYGRGIEENAEENLDYTLESYREVFFDFSTQYRATEWFFVNAGVGVIYRGTQDVFDEKRARREIQAGTGSLFHLGAKKPLSEWSLVEFTYSLLRRDYFVKGVTNNLEGDESRQSLDINYTMAF